MLKAITSFTVVVDEVRNVRPEKLVEPTPKIKLVEIALFKSAFLMLRRTVPMPLVIVVRLPTVKVVATSVIKMILLIGNIPTIGDYTSKRAHFQKFVVNVGALLQNERIQERPFHH